MGIFKNIDNQYLNDILQGIGGISLTVNGDFLDIDGDVFSHKLDNIVTVAKSGGDYTSIKSAIDSKIYEPGDILVKESVDLADSLFD